jgi:heavy metal sensor kinase
MLKGFHHSLAVRLALLYTLVFALVTGALFAALYWDLARALEKREHAAVESLAAQLAAAYGDNGAEGLRERLNSDASPEVRSFFVRVFSPDNQTLFASVPPDWVQTQVQNIPLPPELGLSATRSIETIRIPQNALRDYAIASARLPDDNILQVGRSTDSRAVFLQPLRRAFAVAGAAALALSAAAGALLAWRATRPLRQVSGTARRILETGDLSARVPGASGTGELALLVGQFNTLLDRNAAHVRVLRETLDNLAHDLRTPLTRLRGSAEMALRDEGERAEARAALAGCIEETDRLLHVIDALLDISAAEGGALALNRAQVDLRSLVERAADLYREVAEEKKISVELDMPVPVECAADSVRLGHAVNNLLDNALKYTPEGGRVALAAWAEAGSAFLTVTDNGPGVPDHEQEAIFRRLYRGDASRSQRGTGLGLSLVKAVVEAHGGSVWVENALKGGARFIVSLPLR